MLNFNENSYFAFAEADYPYFRKMYEDGYLMPGLAAVGQNIAERYLKHIIREYANPEDESEAQKKEDILRTHSLSRLLRYMERDMRIEISPDTEDEILKSDGYYFSTKYPGDNSYIASTRDLERAYHSVIAARELVCGLMEQFQADTNTPQGF